MEVEKLKEGPLLMGITAPKVPAGALQIWDDTHSEPLVTITYSGQITYGPHYTPDAAAKIFWEAIRTLCPTKLGF